MKKLTAGWLAISFVAFSIFSPHVQARPQGYTVVSGEVSFDESDPNTLLVTASDRAIINFESFNIAANEAVRFIQNSVSSSVLSRVTGTSASNIFGTLFSNGQLLLVNPNGIVFHEIARIQVGSLIASTLDIQNALYEQNKLVFEKIQGSAAGSIVNEAAIAARDTGHIALLSEAIRNAGTLTANLGSVVLGVGEKQTLSFDSNNLINLVIDKGVVNPVPGSDYLVDNQGAIRANGGKIILSLKTLDDIFTHLVNNSGIIEASRAIEKNGFIELISNTGIQSLGTLKTDYLFERGAAFRAGGNYLIGKMANLENLDGAANFAGGNYAGPTQDNQDVVLDPGVFTLTADASFLADADGNDAGGRGAFTMSVGASIVGGGFNLTLQTGDNATLRSITGVGNLTLTKSQAVLTPSYTANNAITMAGDFAISNTMTFNAGTNNITVGGNFTLGDGVDTPIFNAPGDNDPNTAVAETMLIGGNFTHSSGTFNHRNGNIQFNGAAGTVHQVSASGLTFWDFTCTAAGNILEFPPYTMTLASSNSMTLTGTGTTVGVNAVTMRSVAPLVLTYQWLGLTTANTNWSNVVVSDLVLPAYVTPGGAGPVIYAGNTANIGPAIAALGNGALAAGILGLQDLVTPSLAAGAEGNGGGGGGASRQNDQSDEDKKNTGQDENAKQSDTRNDAYVYEGIVSFAKSLTKIAADNANGGGGGGGLAAFVPVGGETLLYQGDLGQVDEYGRVKLKMRSLFVTTSEGLRVIRSTLHKLLKNMPLGETPSDVTALRSGERVYAAFPASGNITPVETSNYAMKDPISTGRGLSGVRSSFALSKDEKKIYVTNSVEDTLKVVDLESQKVIKTFRTGSHPSQVIATDDRLLVSNTLDGTISILKAQTGEEITKLSPGGSPYGVALSEETGQLFVADAANHVVVVFDANTFDEKARIAVGKNPFGLKLASSYLFVTNRSDDSLSVIDVRSLKELGRISVGKRPSGLAAIEDINNTKVYVANELSGNLSFITVDKNGQTTLAETIPTGIGTSNVVISSPEKPTRR